MKNLSRILLFCLSAALCFGQAATGVGAPGVSASSVEGGGGGGDGTVTQVSVATTSTTTGSVATDTTTPVISINVIPTPSVTGNSLISGGGVGYVSGLNVTVGAASYIIQGTTYSSVITNLSASAADPTNPRIDVVAVNSSGAAVIITGTPSATPVKPAVDPDTQLELTFYLLAANATSIPVTTADIYFENTEWTMTKSGVPINLASTSNPYSGTVDIEATAAVAGNSFTATKPAAGTFDPATYNTLFFYIRNKAAWANAKSITIQLLRSGVARGSPVTFKGNTFGFNSQTGFTAYQQIAIPTSAFAANGVTCDAIRFSVLGGGGSIGFYVDAITLQSGISPYETSTKMHWAGNYSATLAYNINDVVLSSNIQYVAIQAGVGHTPASSTDYWVPSSAYSTGTVTASGPPSSGQWAKWTSATNLTGFTPGTGVETFATTPTFANLSAAVTGATLFASTTKSDNLQAAEAVTLSSSGTDTYAGTAGVTATAYTANRSYRFTSNFANVGAASLNVNGLGATTIVKVAGGITTALADNDIRSGQVCDVVFDGTNFQLQSTLGNAPSGSGTVTASGPPASTYLPYWTSATNITGSANEVLVTPTTAPTIILNGPATPALYQLNYSGAQTAGFATGPAGTFGGISAAGDSGLFTAAKDFYISVDSTAGYVLRINQSTKQFTTQSGIFEFGSNLRLSGVAAGYIKVNCTTGSASGFLLDYNAADVCGFYTGVAGTFGGVSAAGDSGIFTIAKDFYISTDSTATNALKVSTTGALTLFKTTDSSSVSTGTLIVNGGVGIAKKLYVGTDINAAGSVFGGGLFITSGTNLKAGTFTLASGAATVSNTSITANSVVVMSLKTASGAITMQPYLTARTTGTSFVVAAGVGDNSVYSYIILETN